MTSLRDVVISQLDQLGVPDCDIRRAALDLVTITESPDRAGDIAAASAALSAMLPYIHELYEPKSPLEIQRDYIRARRNAAEDGIEIPAWDELPPDQRH